MASGQIVSGVAQADGTVRVNHNAAANFLPWNAKVGASRR
jgi:hypothetical protein